MRIIALIGSPRKGGNTDLLVDELLARAEADGHTTHKIYLYDHDIRPCVDCRRCKGAEHVCGLRDDMPELYPMLERADLIVFGTPVYWYGPTAKMKLLIDRLRPFIASRRLQGKAGVLVAPSEEGAGCCGPLVDLFRMSFGYLGMTFAGSVLAAAYEKGEVREKPDDMAKAAELGAGLGVAVSPSPAQSPRATP